MLRSSDQVDKADNGDQCHGCESEYPLSPHVARLSLLVSSQPLSLCKSRTYLNKEPAFPLLAVLLRSR